MRIIRRRYIITGRRRSLREQHQRRRSPDKQHQRRRDMTRGKFKSPDKEQMFTVLRRLKGYMNGLGHYIHQGENFKLGR